MTSALFILSSCSFLMKEDIASSFIERKPSLGMTGNATFSIAADTEDYLANRNNFNAASPRNTTIQKIQFSLITSSKSFLSTMGPRVLNARSMVRKKADIFLNFCETCHFARSLSIVGYLCTPASDAKDLLLNIIPKKFDRLSYLDLSNSNITSEVLRETVFSQTSDDSDSSSRHLYPFLETLILENCTGDMFISINNKKDDDNSKTSSSASPSSPLPPNLQRISIKDSTSLLPNKNVFEFLLPDSSTIFAPNGNAQEDCLKKLVSLDLSMMNPDEDALLRPWQTANIITSNNNDSSSQKMTIATRTEQLACDELFVRSPRLREVTLDGVLKYLEVLITPKEAAVKLCRLSLYGASRLKHLRFETVMPNLMYLCLENCSMIRNEIERDFLLKNNLEGDAVSSSSFGENLVRNCPYLTSLNLTGCVSLHDSFFLDLCEKEGAPACHNLRVLKIGSLSHNNVSFKSLKKLICYSAATLEKLDAYHLPSSIGDEFLTEVLCQCRNLMWLNLECREVQGFSSDAFKELLSCLKHLRRVNFRGQSFFDRDCLKVIVDSEEALEKLEYLSVTRCINLDRKEVHEMLAEKIRRSGEGSHFYLAGYH